MLDDEDEIHQRERICVVFDSRVHKARIDAIKRRSRWDAKLLDVIEFRTIGALNDNDHEQVGTVPLLDRGLKWDMGWDDETATALLAANALAVGVWEATVQLDSDHGRPTWVL